MRPFIRCLPCRFLVLWAAVGAARTLAADYPDYAPSFPQSALQSTADQAMSTNPSDSHPQREPVAGSPRAFPVRFQANERDKVARTASFADERAGESQFDRNSERGAIPLSPESTNTRARLRSGELPPLVTGAASLGIVLGLFLLVVWVVRRGMPKSAGVLPREAVEILGRAPLVARQQVHLLRCGNKVLLLSVSATTVETLTEITDPAEVERLAALCRSSQTGVPATFRQVLGQHAKRRGLDFLTRQHDDDLDFDHEDSVGYRAQESRV